MVRSRPPLWRFLMSSATFGDGEDCSMATQRIRAANNAALSKLASNLPASESLTVSGATVDYTIRLVHVRSLSGNLRDAVYNLFRANLGKLMDESSFAGDESDKKQELFEDTTRYLLATRNRESSSNETDHVDIADEGDLVGYLSFRFDTEETLGERDVEVAYCYELQIAESARGLGLGKRLLRLYEQIGAKAGMQKAMLTLLNSNTQAAAFYASQGYASDEIDPTRMAAMDDTGSESDADDAVDYTILSKRLR